MPKTKLSKKTLKQAENIKNCCEGLITKYKDYTFKHPEPSIETAVLTRLENNFKDLESCLPTTLTTVIQPCSIIELELFTTNLIDKFYDTLTQEIETFDVNKYKKNDHFEQSKESMNQAEHIVSALEQLDETITYHLEQRKELWNK